MLTHLMLCSSEWRTDEAEVFPCTVSHAATMKEQLHSSEGLSEVSLECSVGSPDTRASISSHLSLPASPALTTTGAPDTCEQAEATEQPVDIASSAGNTVELPTDNKLGHVTGEEGIYSHQGLATSTASHSVPSFEGFVRHIDQRSSSKSDQQDKMVMVGITETVMSDPLQLPPRSCCSLSSNEQASMTGSQSAIVSASVPAPHDVSAGLCSTPDMLCTVETSTHQVSAHGSSLVFIPRGLSGGSQPHPLPLDLPSLHHVPSEVMATDLAPDLELDMYGISYSLDKPLDH